MDLFKKYLLASAARFAPPGEGTETELERDDTDGEETVPGDEGEGEGFGEDAGAEEGLDGAEEDAEGSGEGQVDGEPEPARRKKSANQTIRELREIAQTEKADRQRFERELSEIRAAQRAQEQRSQQESPTDRAARRALMDPTEVLREDLQESEERTRNLLQQNAMQQQEANDKLGYNGILRDAPHLRKYDADVEKLRLEQQARGVFVPREVLLDLAIGRAARAAATKKAPAVRQAAARRVENAQSRPAQARGDTATQRGRQGDSVEKRLENVPI